MAKKKKGKKDDPYSKKAYKAWAKEQSGPYTMDYDSWVSYSHVDNKRRDIIKKQDAYKKELLDSGQYTLRDLLTGKGPADYKAMSDEAYSLNDQRFKIESGAMDAQDAREAAQAARKPYIPQQIEAPKFGASAQAAAGAGTYNNLVGGGGAQRDIYSQGNQYTGHGSEKIGSATIREAGVGSGARALAGDTRSFDQVLRDDKAPLVGRGRGRDVNVTDVKDKYGRRVNSNRHAAAGATIYKKKN